MKVLYIIIMINQVFALLAKNQPNFVILISDITNIVVPLVYPKTIR